jgi:competence protein ComEA
VIGAVAVAAAIAGVFLVWHDRPQPRPVSSVSAPGAPAVADGSMPVASGPLVPDTAGPAALTSPDSRVTASSGGRPVAGDAHPATSGTASPTAEPSVIVVSVTGLVRHPGLVRLAPGARVADAIEAAGGVAGDGDLTGMNLAAHLADGSSVVVGTTGAGTVLGEVGPPTAGGSPVGGSVGALPPGTDGLVDLNTADAVALDALPGVGPVMAAAIVTYRQHHGPFTSVDQLQAIPGIGPARFAQIAPHVTLSGGSP